MNDKGIIRIGPNGVEHLVFRNCTTCGNGPHEDWPTRPQLGDTMTGRDVTSGLVYTGRIVEVVGAGRWPRYRLADTGDSYSSGRPIEPIVDPL